MGGGPSSLVRKGQSHLWSLMGANNRGGKKFLRAIIWKKIGVNSHVAQHGIVLTTRGTLHKVCRCPCRWKEESDTAKVWDT